MKKQIKFQKILFLVTLILAAITLVYGFSYCTASLTYAFNARSGRFPGSAYAKDPINADALYTFVMGYEYKNSRWVRSGVGFNDLIIVLCVILVVIAALQFFFASHNRRNYYITNYISVGVLAVFALVVAAVAFWGIAQSEALFNQLDWARYKEVYDRVHETPGALGWQYYSDSHAIFILGYILFSFVLIDVVLLVLNTVWKILLMKGEKALLSKNTIITEAEVLQ